MSVRKLSTTETVQIEGDIAGSKGEEPKHVSISIKIETTTGNSVEEISKDSAEEFHFSEQVKRLGRLTILVGCIVFLIVGRFSVPDNEVTCVEDKVMTALQFANDFINTLGNEFYRALFQGLCSLLVDITFIATFGYWVVRGTGGRLPVTLGIFYVIRALVQSVWFSPFPAGFYWESPGIPSLVVPYGRGSDFFFSGHAGFMTICALEWHRLNMPKIRNFVIFSGLYTCLILLTYRIHYSIDIFTGVFFAEWCYGKVNANHSLVEDLWTGMMKKLRRLLGKKDGFVTFMGQELVSLNAKV